MEPIFYRKKNLRWFFREKWKLLLLILALISIIVSTMLIFLAPSQAIDKENSKFVINYYTQ